MQCIYNRGFTGGSDRLVGQPEEDGIRQSMVGQADTSIRIAACRNLAAVSAELIAGDFSRSMK